MQSAIRFFQKSIEDSGKFPEGSSKWPVHAYYNSLGEALRVLLTLAVESKIRIPNKGPGDDVASWQQEIARSIEHAYNRSVQLAPSRDAKLWGLMNRGVFYEQLGRLQLASQLFWEVLLHSNGHGDSFFLTGIFLSFFLTGILLSFLPVFFFISYRYFSHSRHLVESTPLLSSALVHLCDVYEKMSEV